MQLQEIDAGKPQALEALREAALDRAGDVGMILRATMNLVETCGRGEMRQVAADCFLRHAVAIDGAVSIQLMPAATTRSQRRLAHVLVGDDENAADDPAAKHDLGDIKSGAGEGVSSCSGVKRVTCRITR